ncbi:MAG: dienelactone hydrolase family protein [Thermoguttaceae bacterium]|nr:dienelactone hydrolase family protein [Thermoguttaceae bacterium]
MKNRTLKFESLEERHLLAVWAGGEAGAAELAAAETLSDAPVAIPEPTGAVPKGYASGDVYISSVYDADGDGFIGPSELSYMSYSWFTQRGKSGYRASCDWDGDGFIGPGDYAVLSSCWFQHNDALPESSKSYEIYPSDISNWGLFGDTPSAATARNGKLTIDGGRGEVEAVCDYGEFADNLRVTADFKGTGDFRAGIELAVQDSGARYYAEMDPEGVTLYCVSESGEMTRLRRARAEFSEGVTWTVWMQAAEGQVAFGANGETLAALDDSTLSGGYVGFYGSAGTAVFSNITVEFDPEKVENTVDDLPNRGQQILYTDPVTGLSYWLFNPSDDSACTPQGYPLMIFLHGSGEKGNANAVKSYGPPMLVGTSAGETWPFITVSPVCPKGATWSASQLLTLIDQIASELPVDTSRIYATGLSMGGHGVWDLLIAAPEKFAAAAPLCGWSNTAYASLLVDIPIWAFHGTSDPNVSYQRSVEMINAIRTAGGTKAQITLYEGVGHNCWTVTYNNPDLYTWFLSNTR